LARRLRLTRQTDPVAVEHDLNALVPPEERGRFSLRLIEHGRRVCDARRPRCDECVLAPDCPSAGKFPPAGAKRAAKQAPRAAKRVTGAKT
jgi:endonuclease-3